MTTILNRRRDFSLHAMAEAYETVRRSDEGDLQELLGDLKRAKLQLMVAVQCIHDMMQVVAQAVSDQDTLHPD